MKPTNSPRRRTRTTTSLPAAHVSAYLRQNHDLERALATGDLAEELTAYYGEAGYEEMVQLVRDTAQRRVEAGAERVLIVPGIMGTKLGIPKAGMLGTDDVIWLDPKDVALGTLTRLSLGAGGTSKIVPLGAMLLFYLKLKLRLRAAGFDADFWGYDWRRSVHDLGSVLARHVQGLPGNVHIVAHSMGGLVARAALRQGAGPRVQRLVMLGTPNHGSFMATQAVRATLDTIRTLATFDPSHSAEELSNRVFNTFPSLYELLPSASKFTAFDLFDPTAWPKDGPQPVPALLRAARDLPDGLAPASDRFHVIAGVNQPTVTGLDLHDGQFVYSETLDGDGTVPLAFARLEGASIHHVDETHGSLPNHSKVARAVADLLRTGQTNELPSVRAAARGGPARQFNDAALRGAVAPEKHAQPPPPSQARELLARFVSARTRDAAAAEPHVDVRFDSLVVSRRRQHRLDLCIARGDITAVDARAVVLGLFREVTPSGAARAIDRRMDGAISEMVARRMFAGNVGEVFILPTGRHPVRAETVLFAGLGTFDAFAMETLEVVAEHTIRMLIRTDVEDFATVLLGGNSGQSIGTSLEHLLRGFVRGLLDADRDFRFRRITLCESDPARFSELRRELYRLAGTTLLKDVEVTLDERVLPGPDVVEEGAARGVATVAAHAPNYLIVRQEGAKDHQQVFRSSLLTAGAKATVVNGEKSVPTRDLDGILAEIETDTFTGKNLPSYGQRLGRLLLADEVLQVLPTQADRHLVVVHDAPSSRVPWETLHVGGQFPATQGGLSRRYLAENLSVAKWLETRRQQPVLDVLLVVNPTGDLSGAETEGERIQRLLNGGLNARVTVRHGKEATREALRADFRSGRYDLVHYAGHAFFDPKEPSRSGILCAGRQVLSGAELSGLGNLPNLVVFNACEAGRIRSTQERKQPQLDMARRVERAVGLAEAFLRGGVANYIGTYWPVGDNPADRFADVFYRKLLQGHSIGDALLDARNNVRATPDGQVDWADYIHYGDFNFTLKQRH